MEVIKSEFEEKKEFIDNRIQPIVEVLKKTNLVDEVDPYEALTFARDLGIGPNDYEKLVKTIIYIRHRFIYKKSRLEAFTIAFPERVSDDVTRQTIETKARRVEEYTIYKRLVALLSTNTYISYAFDRMRVLDLSLKKIMSEKTKDRDKIEYMKVFLQETRKPEDAKQLEVNIDVQQNNVSVTKIEDKLSDISKKLEGMTANDILRLDNDN